MGYTGPFGGRQLVLALLVLLVGVPASAQEGRRAGEATTLEAQLKSAAYHEPGAPDVAVHLPAGFDGSRPLHLVVFLHGYRGCVRVLMGKGRSRCKPEGPPRAGWELGARHDEAQTNTVLVVPQLAFMKRSGRPGCFARRGCFHEFLEEVLSRLLSPRLGRALTLQDVETVSLVAHSAGFETALAVLEQGEVAQVRNVVLFDALYSGAGSFAAWLERNAAAGAKLLSVHLGRGKTAAQSQQLGRRLRRVLGPDGVLLMDSAEALVPALRQHSVVVARGRGSHRAVPEHYLASVLRGLGLPAR